jgi:ABC-2 type transport system ATP-binding protein
MIVTFQMSAMNVIETRDLTKHYGKLTGVSSLSFSVSGGEIFGFLGPNGAGKTTTIRLLLDLLHPEQGSAKIFGLDSRLFSTEIRRRLGYIPGEVVLYDGMTGMEFLKLMSSFRSGGDRRLKELRDRLDLDLRKKTRAYSKGMKQKLAIIQAFMHDPELLILDEPTLGLDPLVQHEFYEILLEEKARGKTVFLSSHILTEVERVCDRVGIVRSGQLVDLETISGLKLKKVRRMHIIFSREVPVEELGFEGADIVRVKGRELELRVRGETAAVLKRLCSLPVEDMSFPEASLEDTFMQYYGAAS